MKKVIISGMLVGLFSVLAPHYLDVVSDYDYPDSNSIKITSDYDYPESNDNTPNI